MALALGASMPAGRLAASLAYLVTTLMWAILAWDSRRSVRRELERWLLPAWPSVVTTAMTLPYLLEKKEAAC